MFFTVGSLKQPRRGNSLMTVEGNWGRAREELTKSGRIFYSSFLTGTLKLNIWRYRIYLYTHTHTILNFGEESLVSIRVRNCQQIPNLNQNHISLVTDVVKALFRAQAAADAAGLKSQAQQPYHQQEH